mgnify:CR=1 FL=1
MTLHYEFPKALTLDEVREIVRDNPNFYIGERDGYVVANYLVAGKDTHPPVVDRKTAIMRELRGLIFDRDGRVASRRLHKFFNLGEREDVAQIDVSKPHVVLEKLDGSMITPFMVDGVLRWGTKMGLTEVADQVEKFIEFDAVRASNYKRLALAMIEQDCTPIFEWCSRKQRIVIDYPEDRLVLIAVRDNETGEYVSFDRLLADYPEIPRVNELAPIADLDLFTQELRKREDIEGVVIRFADGHMVKVKTDTYLALHRAKSELESERNVVRLILEDKVDDLLPLLMGEDYVAMIEYIDKVNLSVRVHVDLVNAELNYVRENKVSRKDFALSNKLDPSIRTFVFKHWDDACTRDSVVDFVLKHLGSNKSYEKCHTIIVDRWREVDLDE